MNEKERAERVEWARQELSYYQQKMMMNQRASNFIERGKWELEQGNDWHEALEWRFEKRNEPRDEGI